MVKITRRLFIASALLAPMTRGALAAGTPTTSVLSAAGYDHPDWLVESGWLASHLADSATKVVALTPAKDFAAGHLPGAGQIDWGDLQIVETSDQAVSTWEAAVEARLTSLGLSPSDTVVVYDGGTVYAPRLWWILRQLGHADVRILNGGLPAWIEDGGAAATGGSTTPASGRPYVGAPDASAITTLAEAAASVGVEGVAFVDARTAEEYAAGHIPGAVNVPFLQNVVSDSPHRWKTAGALRRMYEDAGVAPNKHIIPYCSTGVRSAATYFTLSLIGYPQVSLFTGSWTEWSKHTDLPVVVGSKP